jgi:plastocyanin
MGNYMMRQILQQRHVKAQVVSSVAILIFTTMSAAILAGCSRNPGGPKLRADAADGDHHTAEMEMKMAPAANSSADSPTATNQVTIDNFAFNPKTLTVSVGTEVTWINRDDVPHTATSAVKPRAFDSKTLDTDDKFSHVFTAPGTYPYFCAVHPHMTGEIVVK